MASAEYRYRLSEEISKIIRKRGTSSTPERSMTRSLVYGSMAALALTPVQSNAVSLGELSVKSALGEPMNAVIPVQLARGETLAPGCVSLTRGASGLSNPAKSRITVPQATGPGAFELQVSTPSALFEPVYELNIRIDCTGTPVLLREYVLMLDLPRIDAPARFDQPVQVQTGTTVTFPMPGNRPIQPQRALRDLSSASGSITAGSNYRVREGDTLSTIARRINGRPADTIWKMSNVIFRMNPNAFIRSNPDLIKLGAEIRIPSESDWSGPIEALQPAERQPAEIRSPQAAAPTREPSAAIRPEYDELVNTQEASAKTATLPIDKQATTDIPAPIAQAVEALEKFNKTVSPFVDEQPTTDAIADAPETLPAPQSTARPAQPIAPEVREVNPLTAIGVGILLGLAISILLLRTRLIAAGAGIFSRKRKGADDAHNDTLFGRTDEMFATDPNIGDETLAIPEIAVKRTQPQDYIVETEEMPAEAATVRDEAAIADADSTTIDPELTGDASGMSMSRQAPSDDTLLDILFAENEDKSVTAEVPIAAAEIFENADLGAGIGDTEEMPPFAPAIGGDEQAAEILRSDGDETAMSSTISDLPEIFAEDGNNAITQEVPTQEMASVATSETQELDLENLARAADDNDALSETLMEALTMLEQDYEEELSASQILDQAAIEKALSANALSDLDSDEKDLNEDEKDLDAETLAKISG